MKSRISCSVSKWIYHFTTGAIVLWEILSSEPMVSSNSFIFLYVQWACRICQLYLLQAACVLFLLFSDVNISNKYKYQEFQLNVKIKTTVTAMDAFVTTDRDCKKKFKRILWLVTWTAHFWKTNVHWPLLSHSFLKFFTIQIIHIIILFYFKWK